MNYCKNSEIRILLFGNEEHDLRNIVEAFRRGKVPVGHDSQFCECASSSSCENAAQFDASKYDISVCLKSEDALDAVSRSLEESKPFSVAFLDAGILRKPIDCRIAQRILDLDPALNIAVITDILADIDGEITSNIAAPDRVLSCLKSAPPSEIMQVANVLAAKSASERRLSYTRSRFRQLLTSTPVIIYSRLGNCEEAFTFVSENIKEQFGYDTESFVCGTSFWIDRVHPEDRPMVKDKLQSLDEIGQLAIEYRFKKDDGEYRWIRDQMRGIRNEQDQPIEIVGCWLDINDRKKAEDKISYLAYFDDLTGLPNRAFMKEMLEHSLSNAKRYGQQMAVLFLDIDHFKRINDNLGHDAGDSLLREVSKRLVSCVRDSDTVFRPKNEITEGANDCQTHAVSRLGGDEFIVILNRIESAEDAATAAKRIASALSAPLTIGTDELSMAASVGISLYPSDGADSATLLKNADAALYFAKEKGRNSFQFFTNNLNERTAKRYSIETKLKKALDRDEFVLHYQPVVDLQNGKIVGTEALIRWQQPDDTLIAPAEFIPIAEETGLIVPIGDWVLQEACRQTAAWHSDGLPPLFVSVNVSAVQFKKKTLARSLVEAVESNGLRPEHLQCELTESVIVQDTDESSAILEELRETHVGMCVDDFGTGYSSLSYLKFFPIRALKVPRCFVRDLTTDLNDAAIVSATIALAHNLGLCVIAEGIEHRDQLLILKSQGCNQAQGYLFSRPLPAKALPEWVRSEMDLPQQEQRDVVCGTISPRLSA